MTMPPPATLRAPGKLFWLGEFAVLSGAPAVVAAVDRHAELTVEASSEARFIEAGDALPFDRSHPNPLVAAIAAALIEAGLTSRRVQVSASSRALVDGEKLGLGSSAAVAAGLVAAFGPTDAPADLLAEVAVAGHRRFQGGRGSGGDVLAACFGGLQVVSTGAPPRAVAMPPALRFAVIATGHAASTRDAIDAFERVRARRPEAVDELSRLAVRGAVALAVGDVSRWLDAVSTWYAHEVELTACGVPIVTGPVRDAVDAAVAAGWVAKPSGAGGGDVVVAFGGAEAEIDRLDAACAAAHVQRLPLAIAPAGVLHGRPTR